MDVTVVRLSVHSMYLHVAGYIYNTGLAPCPYWDTTVPNMCKSKLQSCCGPTADAAVLQLCCCGQKVSSSAGIQRKWASHFSRNIFHCVFSVLTSSTGWREEKVEGTAAYQVCHVTRERRTYVPRADFGVWCFPCLGLNKHVSSLWTCVSGLNDTVIRHGGLLDFIQNGQDDIHSRVKNLNSSLNQVSRDLQGLSEHDLTGELLLPLILFGGFSATVWFLSTAPLWSE